MAEITKPIALDESFNTTEGSPRNVADVLAQGIGDLVTVVSRISHQTTYDELSDLEDVNISAPTNGNVLTYDGSKWVNGQGGGGSVEQMIAPVETSTTASQAYAIGEQFILNGTLYTATAAITAGGTITINGNCTASDTVTEQSKWKQYGSAFSTGNPINISLPTIYDEIIVKCVDTAGRVYNFHICRAELTATSQNFFTAYFASTSYNGYAVIGVSNTAITRCQIAENGSFVSTSSNTLYYR